MSANSGAKDTSLTRGPAAAKRAALCSMRACTGGSAASQAGVRQMPMRGPPTGRAIGRAAIPVEAGGVRGGVVAGLDRGAVFGRHVGGVDDVLDPGGQAGEVVGWWSAIGGARQRRGVVWVGPGPGLDGCALLGALQAGADQSLGGQ